MKIEKAYVDSLTARLPELESALADPALAAQRNRYRDMMREHAALSGLKRRAEAYFQAVTSLAENRELMEAADTDEDIRQLAGEEAEAIASRLGALEQDLLLALMPADASEQRGAIVEIRAGTGGDEAALFAADLFRMYSRYAEAQGWKVNVIDASTTPIGGYKELVCAIESEGAYGRLRYESGGHRVQRVPVTEASGRIHTSAATVAVFPEAEPEDDIRLDPEELRIDIFCSSGPGGQSVNTTYSAVRVTHLPTGLVAQSQDERSQHRNKEKALAVLKARILDLRRRQEEESMGRTRRSMIGSGDRSERIRTYNFPQNRLTDHRINLTLYNLDRIMEGEIGEVLDTLRRHDAELRLKEEAAAGGGAPPSGESS